MKLVFTQEESMILGYREIELTLEEFEFNTKAITIPAPPAKEPEYMGAPEADDPGIFMALAYTLSMSGSSPTIRTIAK
jgi:hypothetical protein